MTLDEAIRHAEEAACKSCDKCAVEHRQLAAWLKRLKALEGIAGDGNSGDPRNG